MNDLFSHEEQSGDEAVAQQQTPSGVIFLEPASAAAEPELSPKPPVQPDFS